MFEQEAFRYMPNLIDIDFSQNLITDLDFYFSFEFNQTKVTKLDFHSNQIKLIRSHFFTKFPHVKQLDFSFNKLQYLKNIFFTFLNDLDVLDLSSNQILTIENSTFDYLNSLKYLNLRNNLIYDLSGQLFRNLSNLIELNMSKNKIESISKEHLEGLSSLKMLDLSENLFKSLNKDTFSFVASSIETLILKLNRIHTNGGFVFDLKRLKYLELSCNSIIHLNLSSILSISHLDLSSNNLRQVQNWNLFENTSFLNMSKTNAEFILKLKFSTYANIEELDLSFNNLTSLPGNYLANLKKLAKLCLKETNLIQFDILKGLKQFHYVDLSSNNMVGQASPNFIFSYKLKVLKISNVSLSSFRYLEGLLTSNVVFLNYLDISSNDLSLFNYNIFVDSIKHLDISDNKFNFLFSDQVLIYDFYRYHNLAFINMTKSMLQKLSDKIFQFNNKLENAHMSGNHLLTFPLFCSDFWLQCMLKVVDFNSNNLDHIKNINLMYVDNLEYLDISNNRIEFIESGSFDNLISLEILLLSRNKLNSINGSFKYLESLQLLDLSFNFIETIPERIFSDLFKLEILDLTHNKIYEFESVALENLDSLKYLYIYDNADHVKMKQNSFLQLRSLQNIYISKSILNNDTVSIFNATFKYLNRNSTLKNNRTYFKSLSLITSPKGDTSSILEYDCDWTLHFIRLNIHLNLKTESDISQYFAQCSQYSLKNVSSIQNDLVRLIHAILVLSDGIAYFMWIMLLFVSLSGCILCLHGLRDSFF